MVTGSEFKARRKNVRWCVCVLCVLEGLRSHAIFTCDTLSRGCSRLPVSQPKTARAGGLLGDVGRLTVCAVLPQMRSERCWMWLDVAGCG